MGLHELAAVGGWRWGRSRRSSVTCLRLGAARPRSAHMEWTCCGGFGFRGQSRWRGTVRAGWRPRVVSMACHPERPEGLCPSEAVLGVRAGAQRNGGALLLRFPPRRRHRTGDKSVSAGSVAARSSGARSAGTELLNRIVSTAELVQLDGPNMRPAGQHLKQHGRGDRHQVPAPALPLPHAAATNNSG